jgi:hypothetical protein
MKQVVDGNILVIQKERQVPSSAVFGVSHFFNQLSFFFLVVLFCLLLYQMERKKEQYKDRSSHFELLFVEGFLLFSKQALAVFGVNYFAAR